MVGPNDKKPDSPTVSQETYQTEKKIKETKIADKQVVSIDVTERSQSDLKNNAKQTL